MDLSKYLAIFASTFIIYVSLKQKFVSKEKLLNLLILSGSLSIYISYLLLILYFLGFRSTSDFLVHSFDGTLGVWETSGFLPRLAGTTAEPQQFSVIFLTPLLLLLSPRKSKKNIFTITLGIFALLLSQSKFALISLSFVLIFIFILYKKYRFLIGFCAICTVPFLVLLLLKLPTFSEGLQSGSEGSAFTERLDNLLTIAEILKNNFFMGIGAGQYGTFRGQLLFGDPMAEPNYAPNIDLLKIFSETGIFGFLLVLALFYNLFIFFFKTVKRLSGEDKVTFLAILFGSIAIFLNMLVGYELLHVFFWINIGFLLYLSEHPGRNLGPG